MDGFIGERRDWDSFSLSNVNCEGKCAELLPVKKLQSIMDDSHSWQKNTSTLKGGNGETAASLDRTVKWSLVAIKCYDLEHRYQT